MAKPLTIRTIVLLNLAVLTVWVLENLWAHQWPNADEIVGSVVVLIIINAVLLPRATGTGTESNRP